MNPIRQLFGLTAIYGLGTVVPRLLNYVLLTPFFTRIFELGEYGVVTELYAYVVFLLVILTYGMETGFFRYAEKYNDPDKVYSTSMISLFSTSGIFILTIWLFSQPIADLTGYPNNKNYIIWIGIIVGIDAFTAIPFALLRKQNKALKFATIKIINVVVNISLNFLFLLFIPAVYEKTGNAFLSKIFNPELGVGYVFVSNLIASLCTLLLLSGEIFRVTLKFSRRLWFEMIIYSFPLLISGLAGTINEALDRVLLKHLITAETDPLEQVGIYGANYKIAVLMQLFIQMFRFAAEPFYFARAKDKNARILYADIMKYFVIACMLIFLVVTLYIDLFKHFIGSAFHEGLHIVPVVLYAIFLLGIFFNLSIWYKLNNLTKYGAIITLIGSLVTFFVNWLFIPRFGYTASAWGHFFCYMIMVVISWLLCRKYFYIPYDLKKIIFYSLLPVVIFVLTVLLDPNSDVMKWIINTFFIAVYIAIVIAFERSNLLELFRSKP